MSIERSDVLHVCELAALRVPEAELPVLVEQLRRIVAFVEQLREVPAGEEAPPFEAGPPEAPLRDDSVGADPLARPPAAFAPGFREGFFTVPRHAAMEDL